MTAELSELVPLLAAGYAVTAVTAGPPVVQTDRCGCCPLFCCRCSRGDGLSLVQIPLTADESAYCTVACLTLSGAPSPAEDCVLGGYSYSLNGQYSVPFRFNGQPSLGCGVWVYYQDLDLPAVPPATAAASRQAVIACPSADLPPGSPPTYPGQVPGYVSASLLEAFSRSVPVPPGIPPNAVPGCAANYGVQTIGPPQISADGATFTWGSVSASQSNRVVGRSICLSGTGGQVPAVRDPATGLYSCPPCGATIVVRFGGGCDSGPVPVPTPTPTPTSGGDTVVIGGVSRPATDAAPCDGCGPPVRPPVPLTVAPNKCQHLGDRLEFKNTCASGYGCRHRCGNPAPAVLDAHLGGNPEMTPANDCGPGVCPGYLDSDIPWGG